MGLLFRDWEENPHPLHAGTQGDRGGRRRRRRPGVGLVISFDVLGRVRGAVKLLVGDEVREVVELDVAQPAVLPAGRGGLGGGAIHALGYTGQLVLGSGGRGGGGGWGPSRGGDVLIRG